MRISEIEKIPPALAACIEDLEDGGWTEVSRPDVDPINHLPMFHRRHPTDLRITLSIRESWFDRGKVFVKVFIADVEVAMSTIVGRFTADLLVRYAETLEGVSAAVPAWMRVRPRPLPGREGRERLGFTDDPSDAADWLIGQQAQVT